jgi:hypothetical protein
MNILFFTKKEAELVSNQTAMLDALRTIRRASIKPFLLALRP